MAPYRYRPVRQPRSLAYWSSPRQPTGCRMMWSDWKTWAMAAFAGLTFTVIARVSYELFSDSSDHLAKETAKHAIFNDRLERLEQGKVASTMKRYTADNHAAYAIQVEARFEAMEKRHAAHLAQVSAERVAHDHKCQNRWDSVAELKARVAVLEAMK